MAIHKNKIAKKSNSNKLSVKTVDFKEKSVSKISINKSNIKKSKINKKGKLSTDVDDQKKPIVVEVAAHESDDEDVEDDDNMEDDDNIKVDDKHAEDIAQTLTESKPSQVKSEEFLIKQNARIAREEYNAEFILKRKQEFKIRKEEGMKGVKEMFLDTPKLESESLKEQIHNRLIQRMKRTIVMNNIPNKFKNADVKALVPDMVSCMIPYNFYYHKVGGTAYIDVDSAEKAAKIADQLRNTEIKGRKPFAMVQTKIIDDVDKYNCQRLVIANLSNKATMEQLKELLPKATRIEILPLKGVDRKMTMTAFAQYASVEEAIEDYDTKHGAMINDSPINVKFQIRNDANIKDKQSNFDKKRLSVMGLHKDTKIEELKRCFPGAARIKPTLDKGIATIVYTNEEDCGKDKALVGTHGPPAKWRVCYAAGSSKMKDEPRSTTDIKDKKKKDKRKPDGDRPPTKKFGKGNFSNKKRSGDKKFEGKKFGGNKFKKEST